MKTEYDHFIETLERYGSATWLDSYFDVLKNLFLQLNIQDYDPQLAMTVTGNRHLMINFGQRVISQPMVDRRRQVGLIFPFETDAAALGCRFEFPFPGLRADEAKFVSYVFREGETLPWPIYSAWEWACIVELRKGVRSRYRRFHSSLFYNTVMIDELRQQVLRDVEEYGLKYEVVNLEGF